MSDRLAVPERRSRSSAPPAPESSVPAGSACSSTAANTQPVAEQLFRLFDFHVKTALSGFGAVAVKPNQTAAPIKPIPSGASCPQGCHGIRELGLEGILEKIEFQLVKIE